MKVLTILGTRPEIIRLRSVIDVLDATTQHVLVHTGQNFEDRLSRVFFEELGLREPDVHLGIRASSFAEQVGRIVVAIGPLLETQRPDVLLILGDTNSGLTSIVAKRMGIDVFHMEAGNRCYDDRVPEEVNRRVIDHCSTWLLPYTHRSKENLLAEGIERRRICVVGNPIREVMLRYQDRIDASTALEQQDLAPGRYFLATAHRAETVDAPDRMESLVRSLEAVIQEWDLPLVCSVHPRTADRMLARGVASDRIRFVKPLGFFDFLALERAASCVLSDSGTVQEECCILGVPAVTLRDVTERPETIECGSNILGGVRAETVLPAVEVALRNRGGWTPPPEYMVENVSEVVGRVILSGARFGDMVRSPILAKPSVG